MDKISIYFVGLIVVSVVLVFGSFIQPKLKFKINNIFFVLISGLFFLISGFAVLNSYGKTLFIYPFIYLVFFIIKNFHIPSYKISLNQSLLILIFYSIAYLLNMGLNFPINIKQDLLFYSSVSEFLDLNGVESPMLQYSNDNLKPYHYIEMYLTNFIKLFNINSTLSNFLLFRYLTYSIFLFVFYVGLYSVFKIKKWWIIPIIVMVSFFNLEFCLNILSHGWDIKHILVSRPNFIVYYFISILLFHAFSNKDKKLIWFILLVSPGVSVVILPALITSILVFTFFTKKDLNIIKIDIILSLLYVISIFLFYGLFTVSSNDYSFEKIKPNELFNFISNYKIVLFYIFLLSSLVLIWCLPLFIFYRFLRKNNELLFICFIAFLSAFVAITFFQIFYFRDNFYQLPYFAYSFIGLIWMVFILDFLLNRFNLIAKFSFLTVVFFICFFSILKSINFNIYSSSLKESFLSGFSISYDMIKNSDKIKSNSKIAFDLSLNEIKNRYDGHRYLMVYSKGREYSVEYDNLSFYGIVSKELLLNNIDSSNRFFNKINSYFQLKGVNNFEILDKSDWFTKNNIDFFIPKDSLKVQRPF